MGLFFNGPPGADGAGDNNLQNLLKQAGLLPAPSPLFGDLSFPTQYAWEEPKGADAQAVRRAALKALSLLNPGQDESTNVRAYTGDFAGVVNPGAISTQSWHPSLSFHSNGTLESPPLPGYPGYVVKMYDDPQRGNTIATTYPTFSLAHILHAIPDYLGYPQNPDIARDFLNAAPANGPNK